MLYLELLRERNQRIKLCKKSGFIHFQILTRNYNEIYAFFLFFLKVPVYTA